MTCLGQTLILDQNDGVEDIRCPKVSDTGSAERHLFIVIDEIPLHFLCGTVRAAMLTPSVVLHFFPPLSPLTLSDMDH